MSNPTNCADHKEMHADIIETKTIAQALKDNVKDLYDKHGEIGKEITSNNTKVMEKLSELKVCFITQEGARDRRKLDSLKSFGKNLLRAAGWILALGLTGGLSFATAYGSILKYWR